MSNQNSNGEGIVKSDRIVKITSTGCGHEGTVVALTSDFAGAMGARFQCIVCGRTFAEDPNEAAVKESEGAIKEADAAPKEDTDCPHSHTVNIDPLSNEGATLECLDCGRKFIFNGEQGGLPGGSTPSLYALPKDAVELQDLIEYRGMNFAVGNVFKACYRLGMKRNVDAAYDLRKIIFFAERELRRIENLSE